MRYKSGEAGRRNLSTLRQHPNARCRLFGYCLERRCLGTWWAPPPSKRPRREIPVWRVRFPSTSAISTS